MLKGIPPCISPELIKTMMEMGHDDELILADANFPAASMAQRLIRYDGITIPELLNAILQEFSMNRFVFGFGVESQHDSLSFFLVSGSG